MLHSPCDSSKNAVLVPPKLSLDFDCCAVFSPWTVLEVLGQHFFQSHSENCGIIAQYHIQRGASGYKWLDCVEYIPIIIAIIQSHNSYLDKPRDGNGWETLTERPMAMAQKEICVQRQEGVNVHLIEWANCIWGVKPLPGFVAVKYFLTQWLGWRSCSLCCEIVTCFIGS